MSPCLYEHSISSSWLSWCAVKHFGSCSLLSIATNHSGYSRKGHQDLCWKIDNISIWFQIAQLPWHHMQWHSVKHYIGGGRGEGQPPLALEVQGDKIKGHYDTTMYKLFMAHYWINWVQVYGEISYFVGLVSSDNMVYLSREESGDQRYCWKH